jgi:hypothetical protein
MRLSQPESIVAGRRDVGGEPLAGETAPDEARHAQVVLDDQHPHALILGGKDERKMTAA